MGHFLNDKRIREMFEDCGLMFKGKDASNHNHLLPERKDLMYAYATVSGLELEYKNADEDFKLKTIKKFLSKNNCFKIIDWKFFFTNPNIIDMYEQKMLKIIFNSIVINCNDNTVSFVFYSEFDDYIRDLTKNKDFINVISKEFSKEFQVKTIFLPDEQISLSLIAEIVNLIGEKITELGVLEKFEVELPKLILNDLG